MNESYHWQEHVLEHPAKSAMITLVIYAVVVAVTGALPALLWIS